MAEAKFTVYAVVFAERFAHVTEGMFSTFEKAEVFRKKLVVAAGAEQVAAEVATEVDFDALYEVREWCVDELDEASLQYGAIASTNAEGEREISELGYSDFVAEIRPNEYVHYTDGTVAEIAYGRTVAEAAAKLQVSASA